MLRQTDTDKNCIASLQQVQARVNEFLTNLPQMDRKMFDDRLLKLDLELLKYGEHIKLSLLLERPVTETGTTVTRTRKPRQTRQAPRISPAELEGASDEEREIMARRAIVEQTPPPGSVA